MKCVDVCFDELVNFSSEIIKMQNPSQPEIDSAKSSGSSSSYCNTKSSENIQSSSLLSDNVVYTEEKHSSYNSYYLSYDNVNETSRFSIPKHNFKPTSAFCTNSRFKVEDKVSESSSLIGQKPLVASFEYSPSGKCIKSSFPLKSIHGNSFSTPERTSVSDNPFKSGSTNQTPFKGASNFGSNKQFSSLNKYKSPKNIYKSPSSNFVCSKCGLGYPCTLFLCKSAKTSSSGIKQEYPLDGNNSSKSKDTDSIEISDWKTKNVSTNNVVLSKHSSRKNTQEICSEVNSSKRNSLEGCTSLPAKKSCQASSKKSVEDLISRLFSEKRNKQLIPNGKESPKKNKLSKRKSKGSNIISDFESSKRIKDVSFANDTKGLFEGESIIQSVTVNRGTHKVSKFGKAVTSSISNCPVIGSNRSNYGKHESALSQETRNFLNELAASSSSNNFDDTLASQRSQTFNSEISNATESAVLTFSNSQAFNSEKSDESIEFAVLPLPNALVLSSEIIDETESAVLTLSNLQTFGSEKIGENIKSAVLPLPNALQLSSGISDETESAVFSLQNSQIFRSEKSDESIENAVLPLPNALHLSSGISDETVSAGLNFQNSQIFSSEKSGESIESAVLPLPNTFHLSSGINDETESADLTLQNSQIFSSEKSGESIESAVLPLPNTFHLSSGISDETESAVLTLQNTQTFSSKESSESIKSKVLPLPNALVLSAEISDETESAILTLSNSQTFSSEKSSESTQSSVLTCQSSQNLTSEINIETIESVISTPTNLQTLSSEVSDEIIPFISSLSNSQTFDFEINNETKQSAVLTLPNSQTLSSETSEIIESEISTFSNSEALCPDINYESSECILENSSALSSEVSGESIESAVLPLPNPLALSEETESVVLTSPNSQTLTSGISCENSEVVILSPSNSQTLNSEFNREIIPVSTASNSETLDSESNHETKPSGHLTLPNSIAFIPETSEIIECEVLALPSSETLGSETIEIIKSGISTFPNSKTLSLEINGESSECILENSPELSSKISGKNIESTVLPLSNALSLCDETEIVVLTSPNFQTLTSELSGETSESIIPTPSNSQILNSEFNREILTGISASSNLETLDSESNHKNKPSELLTLPNSIAFIPETSEIIECEVLTLLSPKTLNSEISGRSIECTHQNLQSFSSEISAESIIKSAILPLPNTLILSSETNDETESAVFTVSNLQTLSSEISIETTDSAISTLSNSHILSPKIRDEFKSDVSMPSNSKGSKLNHEFKPSVVLTLPNSQTFSIETSEIIESEVLIPEVGGESAECTSQNSQTLSSETSVKTVESALSNSQTLNTEVTNKILESAVLTLPNTQTLNFEVISESTESVILTPSNSQTLTSELNNETKSILADSETCVLESCEISEFEEVLTVPVEAVRPLRSSESVAWISQNSQTSSSEITDETVEFADSKLSNSQVLNPETFSETIESVILTFPNSESLSLETSNEIVIESDVCENKMSVSNEDEEHCQFTDENKDLTNALDMIQQSSIYDKDLSSAEICNSLNAIFSENDSGNLSVNEVQNSDIVQTEETVVDMETSDVLTPPDINNESEIYLRTTSDGSISADTETYINLSDLYLGDNPDNFQNILIIQDEDGNVETLYFLQDSNIGEDGVVLAEDLNVETVAGNTASAENILVGNSVDELQKLLISQGITNAADILIAQNSVNDQNELDNLVADSSLITAPTNLEEYHNHSVIDNLSEEVRTSPTVESEEVKTSPAVESEEVKSSPVVESEEVKTSLAVESEEVLFVTEDQCTENNHLNVLAAECIEGVDNIKYFSNKVENEAEESSDKVENIKNDFSDEFKNITKDSPDKVRNITEDSSDKVENILLTLSNNREISLNVTSDKKISHSVVGKQSVCDSSLICDIEDNQNFESNTSEKVELSRKAKKSISRFESNIQNAIQDSDYKNNSVLTEKSNKLSELTQNSLLSLPGSSRTSPVNGAVYRSELNNTDSRAVSFKSLNVTNRFISTQFKKFLAQKSKKTVPSNNLFKRSAKKSFCGSVNSSELHYKNNDSLINNQEFSSLNYLALKRRIEEAKSDEYNCHKRTKKDMSDSIDINTTCKDVWPKNRLVALKTFKKPFTSAKKSVLDSREGAITNFKNKALKTCVPRSSLMKTAMKSAARKQANKRFSSDSKLLSKNTSSENVNKKQNSSLTSNSELKTFIQPEICEIRILPNDYLKRASSLLLNRKNVESENADENMSDEEIKMSSGCNSPVGELLSFKSTCSCTAQEVPCICNDNSLQLTCEGEDSMDNNIVPCENSVSQQYLLTPSSEVKHRAFCDIHISRLRQHHCCPKCGIFCSQGEFLRCASDESENKTNHLFHTGCFIIPAAGLPPSCPHCCKFSCFNVVSLVYKSSADSELKEVPSDSQNITHNLNGCDIYMSVHQTPKTVTVSESKIFVPGTNEMQQMITSLATDKTLRLRPTGKCLYNPIRTGDVQKVMQLIGNGVNPNHKFRMHSNNTPLHVAAYYGWIGILHILIQAGASIDAVNDDLETPLIVAVERKQLPIIRYLIHAGAQIDVKDCNGMTSFHIACKNGFKEIAEFLYDTSRIDVNLQDDGGWTSLVWACEHKHLGLVRWLLEIGSDPNVRDNEENTVLHWSAYSGESEIAQLFLDKGCTLSYVNKHGDSALHIAARENNFECVRLFANKGAVLDQKNKNSQTPLMCCEDDSLSYNYLCQCISSGALKLRKMHLEKHVVFRDISRGAESYPIQAINEVDDEEFIMEFRYVVKNCHRSGVEIISTVNNMQFCYCKDNCITRECACTMNSKCWYEENGCLSADFDVFWPPTIFECNKTCHCPKTCINRVVQQGLRCPLQLFRTRFQGWGVRTLQDVPKGAFVCEYVGELITGVEATDRDDDTYFFDLESQDSDYCLDGRYYGNVARFLNHSCEPNLIAVKVFVDYQDLNFPRIAFFTLRHIKAFEELCFDYGLDFWIVKSQSILCTCNTPACKYSKDTIDETLQKFYMDTKAENETTDSVETPTDSFETPTGSVETPSDSVKTPTDSAVTAT